MPHNKIPPIGEIRELRKGDDTQSFNCGRHPLDHFLRKHALSNALKGLGACWIAVHRQHPDEILGYYVLCMAQIEPAEIPPPHHDKLPGYPTPCVRLSRLAVSRVYARQGIGQVLLFDAVRRASLAAPQVGAFGVLVDAKDDQAAGYYKRFGFVPLDQANLTLFIPLATLQDLLAQLGL